MSARATQILLVISALVLFVLLYFVPKTHTPSHEEDAGHNHTQALKADNNASLDVYLNVSLKSLDPAKKTQYDALIKSEQFDSLSGFWDKLKRPDLASVFTERKAQKLNKADDWFKAGNRYYYAVQFSGDKTEVPVLYQCAMRCFDKGLKLEPKNTDARIMLASCFVEGGQDPMQGISMMREIEKTDSNNVKLQLSFAFFSVKSGQTDKAILRFNKVLALDSNYIEAYLHLADAYERLGDEEKTIKALESYAAKTDDVMAKVEVLKYIEKLKLNSNH